MIFASRCGPSRAFGVTLIELVIVIAIVGIIGALIVNFVTPVRSYVDTSRRAALADTADTALRRIGRDVRLALPNSARVDATGKFVEFMLVRTGGRYRLESDPTATLTCPDGASASPADDVLAIGSADTCFKTIGNIPNISAVTTSDYVVVFNLQPASSGGTATPNANAYEFAGTGGNKSQVAAAVAGTGQDRIEFASHSFTYESPGNRFFIIQGPVTYACDLTARTLTRYWGYTIAAAQPTTFSTGSSALLASGVTGCDFTYDSSVTAQGAGLLSMSLQLRMQDAQGNNENVNLYHAVHVNNVP